MSLFCGHYGSGKTNIAVNYAKYLRSRGLSVSIADLDIVNPYFRTKDSEDELASLGIEVHSLPFANSSVDLPSLPSTVYGLVQRFDRYVVMDIGGDDRGAYALGRFTPFILEENNFDMFYVVNFYRPLTPDAESAAEVMKEIEAAAGIPFTAIINNSNLGGVTTPEDILKTKTEINRLSELTGLPVAFTSVDRRISDSTGIPDVFPLTLQKKLF